MGNYPRIRNIQGATILTGVVTGIDWSLNTITMELPNPDPELTTPISPECEAVFAPQNQYWEKFYYTESQDNPADVVSEYASLAFCCGDIVLVARIEKRDDYEEKYYEYYAIGQHEDSVGYTLYGGKPPYVWPLYNSSLIAAFKNNTYSDGTDFPFLTNNNPSLPIEPYTDNLGNTRAVGSATVTNPYGVLEKLSSGEYLFHRQYEFCTATNRLPLEPYDVEKMSQYGNVTLGVSVDGQRILFCGIPIMTRDPETDTTTDYQNAYIISTCPLTIGILQLYKAKHLGRHPPAPPTFTVYYASDSYIDFGSAHVYEFDECLRDLINGVVPLPVFPIDFGIEYPDESFKIDAGPFTWTNASGTYDNRDNHLVPNWETYEGCMSGMVNNRQDITPINGGVEIIMDFWRRACRVHFRWDSENTQFIPTNIIHDLALGNPAYQDTEDKGDYQDNRDLELPAIMYGNNFGSITIDRTGSSDYQRWYDHTPFPDFLYNTANTHETLQLRCNGQLVVEVSLDCDYDRVEDINNPENDTLTGNLVEEIIVILGFDLQENIVAYLWSEYFEVNTATHPGTPPDLSRDAEVRIWHNGTTTVVDSYTWTLPGAYFPGATASATYAGRQARCFLRPADPHQFGDFLNSQRCWIDSDAYYYPRGGNNLEENLTPEWDLSGLLDQKRLKGCWPWVAGRDNWYYDYWSKNRYLSGKIRGYCTGPDGYLSIMGMAGTAETSRDASGNKVFKFYHPKTMNTLDTRYLYHYIDEPDISYPIGPQDFSERNKQLAASGLSSPEFIDEL